MGLWKEEIKLSFTEILSDGKREAYHTIVIFNG